MDLKIKLLLSMLACALLTGCPLEEDDGEGEDFFVNINVQCSEGDASNCVASNDGRNIYFAVFAAANCDENSMAYSTDGYNQLSCTDDTTDDCEGNSGGLDWEEQDVALEGSSLSVGAWLDMNGNDETDSGDVMCCSNVSSIDRDEDFNLSTCFNL